MQMDNVVKYAWIINFWFGFGRMMKFEAVVKKEKALCSVQYTGGINTEDSNKTQRGDVSWIMTTSAKGGKKKKKMGRRRRKGRRKEQEDEGEGGCVEGFRVEVEKQVG